MRKPTKLPTRLESDMYDALKTIDSVKHRLSGCPDEKCKVCAENFHAKIQVQKAIEQFEKTRKYK